MDFLEAFDAANVPFYDGPSLEVPAQQYYLTCATRRLHDRGIAGFPVAEGDGRNSGRARQEPRRALAEYGDTLGGYLPFEPEVGEGLDGPAVP